MLADCSVQTPINCGPDAAVDVALFHENATLLLVQYPANDPSCKTSTFTCVVDVVLTIRGKLIAPGPALTGQSDEVPLTNVIVSTPVTVPVID